MKQGKNEPTKTTILTIVSLILAIWGVIGLPIVTMAVDTIAPETTITAMPAKTATSYDASFNFTSNETGTFQCKLDSGTYDLCASPKTYSALTLGSHTFYVKATDSAGNMDISPAVYFWTIVDIIAPETTITAMPAKTATSYDASFNFTSNETGTFQCKLDSGTYDLCTSPKTYSALAIGSHTFYVKATDSAGNMDISPAVYFWTIVDIIAPETTITAMPAKTATSYDASFNFTSNETGTFQCKLDSGTYDLCTSPKTYSGLTAGSRTFYVKATDSAGNMDISPAVYFWTIVDIIAPETTITAMPAKTATSYDASFNFTSNETGTFQCKLDSGTYDLCTSPKTYSGLTAGSRTFYVKATDSAGNMDISPAVYFWTIVDIIAPETTITAMPDKTAIGTSTSASFSFTSNEAGTFQCKLDSGTYDLCTSPKTYSGLMAGSHTFYVKAIDSAGNMDISPAVYSWTLTITPETTITAMPAKTATSINASFSFISDKAGTFQCKLDSGTYDLCTSPKTYSALTAGAHTFSVRAIDSAGNMDISPAIYNWTIVDVIAPATTITAMPTKTTSSSDASFSFTSNETVTFQCKLYGGPSAPGAYAPCTSPKTYSGLTAGSRTFYVRAIDSAGNIDASPAYYAWTIAIDITAPQTTITAMPAKATLDTSASFSFTSNEAGTFQCKLDSGIYGLCTSPIIYSGLTLGSHTFSVKAIDSAGNVDASPAIYDWAVVEVVTPETTITAMPAKTATSINASFSFISDKAGTFQCKLDSGTYDLCTSPKTYSALTAGAHTFSVRAIDSAGNMDISPAIYNWTIVDVIAPATTITAMPTKTTSSSDASFSFTSNETVTFQCKLYGGPSAPGAYAPCTSPKTYSGLTAGSRTFYVRAIDSAGNIDASPAYYAWTITAPIF